jgi:HK97 family phage major capsid protein
LDKEKKELVDAVKTDLQAEIKGDIEKITKLITDERTKYEDQLKGRISEGDFKAYQEKSHAAENEIKAKIDELEVRLKQVRAAGLGFESKEKSPEMKAFETFIRKGEQKLSEEEQKTMRISEDITGGYVAPIEYRARLIELLTELSPIRQIASTETISVSGVEFPKEGVDSVTAAWPDETLVAGDYKFAMEKFEPFELRALVTPKRTLLDDAAFDVAAYIQRKTADKFAKKEGAAFVSGNAVSKPEGLLTNANITAVNSGDANLLTADGIIKLCYDLPDAYAKNGKFVMKRSSILAIRLFQDSQKQYIWQPSYQVGQPSTLLGYPIIEAIDMPAVAANAYPILFGDFKAGYLIVDRADVVVQRLLEVYATQGLVGFLFWKRVDAQVILAEALRKQKVAA